MAIELFRAVLIWGLHGGTFTNRVGIIAEGPAPNPTDVLAGFTSAVVPSMLAAVSEQVSLIGADVKCMSNPTIENTGYRFEGVIGGRETPSYTTHDQYKIQLYTDTRFFRTGGKLVLGCGEGDVTDSAVDTDMPALLNLIGTSFSQAWQINDNAYACVLFRPDREEGPWDFDFIRSGAYSHIGTAGQRKRFLLGAYTGNNRVSKTFTSNDGSWDDLNQDPGTGVSFTPVGNLIGSELPMTGTLQLDGTVSEYV